MQSWIRTRQEAVTHLFQPDGSGSSYMAEMRITLVVRHQHGLHARPADLFVRKANEFQTRIEVMNLTRESKRVNGKSILGILALGVHSGDSIEISADGTDGAAALEALAMLVNGNFGE